MTGRQYMIAEGVDDEDIETPMGDDLPPELLKFSGVKLGGKGGGNSKIDHPSFSLPAGHTCNNAKDCKSCADRETGALTDSPNAKFRCFAASQENYLTNVRKMRWHNYDLLKRTKNVTEMADLIDRSFQNAFTDKLGQLIIPPVMRLHVGGDFYDQTYFVAWIEMARRYPQMIIYAYTKALVFWKKHRDIMSSNFVLTASRGGTHDYLIDTEKFKSSEVVFSHANAEAKGLPIDHDDSHAAFGDENFATLIHGQQAPKSDASKARSALRKDVGYTGYNTNRKGKVSEGKTYLLTEYQALWLLGEIE